MLLNNVEIAGKIYNVKSRTTNTGKTISEFGLSVYAGKNKEGKSQYKFITCKVWDKVEQSNEEFLIKGKIAFDVWEKDGKEMSRPYILCDVVCPSSDIPDQTQKKEQSDWSLNDDIPF